MYYSQSKYSVQLILIHLSTVEIFVLYFTYKHFYWLVSAILVSSQIISLTRTSIYKTLTYYCQYFYFEILTIGQNL